MDVLAVYHPKGGVGKTTTAVNLAAALAEGGRRVLVVDLDPLASASLSFGVRDDGRALADALTTLDPLPVRATGTPGVKLVPSGAALGEAAKVLAAELDVERILREKLARVGGCDLAILDIPPGLGPLSTLALAGARAVLVPVTRSPLALDGLLGIVTTLQTIRKRLNRELEPPRVLITMVGRRLSCAQPVREDLRRRFGDRLLACEIRRSAKFEKAAACGVPVTAHAPRSRAATEFRRLARELFPVAAVVATPAVAG